MNEEIKEESKNGLVRQIVLFFGVGVINTAIDFFVLNLLTYVFGVHQGVGFALFKAISFTLATVNSYFMNSRFTFQVEKGRFTKDIVAFFIASTIGLVLNVSFATVVVNYTTYLDVVPPQVAVNIGGLSGTIASLAWNFLSYKYLVFKK